MQGKMADSEMGVSKPASLGMTDLPSGILNLVNDLVNDSLLCVSATLLNLILAYRAFYAAASKRAEKHQYYKNAFAYVEINPDAVTTSSDLEPAQTHIFESPFMMLIAMHKDERIAYYVRSLTCVGSQDMRKSSLSCPKTLLRTLKNDRKDLNRFKARISSVIGEIVARPYVYLINDWLANLVNGDRGHGMMVLVRQLVHLDALQLQGPLHDWFDTINFYHTHERDSPVVRSNLRRLEVVTQPPAGMRRLCGKAIRLDQLQRLDIYCQES